MATEIDWTETLGDAMLAQTDDVLDAVQRLRARAAAVGNLETNEAQVVEQTEDSISHRPGRARTSSTCRSTTRPPPTPPPTPEPAGGLRPAGYSTGDLVTTGAIAFGSALLVNEIFDDDDDWDDYWHDGVDIDWDEGELRPDRDIDIEGDVNIDRDRVATSTETASQHRPRRVDVDRDAVEIRSRVGARRHLEAGHRSSRRTRGRASPSAGQAGGARSARAPRGQAARAATGALGRGRRRPRANRGRGRRGPRPATRRQAREAQKRAGGQGIAVAEAD